MGVSDDKSSTEVFETVFAGQCGLGRSRGDSNQIGIHHRNIEVTPDVIGKTQRLIEFSLTESPNVQGNRHDDIDGIERRKSGDHEGSKWSRQ